jgi:hypothetical protein
MLRRFLALIVAGVTLLGIDADVATADECTGPEAARPGSPRAAMPPQRR